MAEPYNALTPNQKQQTAITLPPGPLMILAGAGTGKTYTLENRIVHLIERYNVDPQHMLAITYTERAAKELKTRIINRVVQNAQHMTVSTFHAFCYRLSTDFGDGRNHQLLDESEAIHMLLERFDELGPFLSDEFPMDPQKAVIESFIPFFNRSRDELIDPTELDVPDTTDEGPITEEIANQLRDLQRIYPQFQKWKKEVKVVDFGDMILSAYHLLKSEKSVLKKAQDQYRHIIVDEFQDNNFALNEIMGLIAEYRQFISVVGDDDQVIYSFRGAGSYNIQAFNDRYGHHPNFQSITLNENYRSTQPILDLANRSIENNLDRLVKELRSKIKPEGPLPVRFWGDVEEQKEFIIREILNLLSDKISYHDMAILCRTHGQCEAMIKALKRAGIPVLSPRPNFFGVTAVRNVIAWCQVIGKGIHQDIAFYRILVSVFGYEAAHNLYKQFSTHDKTPRFDLIARNEKLLDQVSGIREIVDTVNRFRIIIQKRTPGEMVWDICNHLNFLKQPAATYSLDDHFTLLNIGNLLKRAQDFTWRRQNTKTDLKAFNTFLEAMMKSRGLPSISPEPYRNLEGVVVNTVHGVKGGEFPIVFMPYQRSAQFPLNYRSDKRIGRPPDEWLMYTQNTDLTPREHHYQEERRLFYVAVTRAQDKLYILAPEKATSQFIKELPKNLMKDHPMIETNIEIKTFSDLKVKYEQKLQNALSREDYAQVKRYSDALAIIKSHESGDDISLGDSNWEKELQKDLDRPFEMDIPDHITLSASAIDTYEACSLKYRLGRLDGIPQTASKPELVFGSLIHQVLQRFHEPEKELTEERILRLMNAEWQSGEYEYQVREEKFMEQGRDMLVRYCRYVNENPPNAIAREEKFTFDLGSITIRGAIDRIDQNEAGTHIIDYKTSRTSSPAKSNLQLAVYSLYLEQSDDSETGGLPASASLHFLRDEEKPVRTHSFSSEDLINTTERIQDVAEGIRNREFDPTKGHHCNWCDYKNLVCPAWEE